MKTFFIEDADHGLFAAWGPNHEYTMRRRSDSAHPGTWTVSAYPIDLEMWRWLPHENRYTAPAVINDFGDLIRVPAPEAHHG